MSNPFPATQTVILTANNGYAAVRLYSFTALRRYGKTIGRGNDVVKGMSRIAVLPFRRGRVGGWAGEPV